MKSTMHGLIKPVPLKNRPEIFRYFLIWVESKYQELTAKYNYYASTSVWTKNCQF